MNFKFDWFMALIIVVGAIQTIRIIRKRRMIRGIPGLPSMSGGLMSRMVRIVLVVVAGAVILFYPQLIAAVTSTGTSSGSESSVIDNYKLDYSLDADGDLALAETIDVRFTETKHGIFRFYDVQDAQDPDVDHPVQIESVQRCEPSGECEEEPYTTYWEDGFYVAKIGHANVTYPAGTVNKYKITTVTGNAITQVTGVGDFQWFWDVVPGGWAMPIDSVSVRATLPTPPTKPIECEAAVGECSLQSSGERTFEMRLTDLPPLSPATWRVTLAPDGLTAVPVEVSEEGEPWHRNIAVKVGFVLVGVGLAAWMFLAIRKRREPKPSEAPVFNEPDPDILPAVWTLGEKPPEDAFQGVLMKLADRKVVEIKPEMSGETVSEDPAWFDVTRTAQPVPPELTGGQEVLSRLGLQQAGSSVRIEKDSKTIGKTVQGLESELRSLSTKTALQRGFATRSGSGMLIYGLGFALPVLAVAATILMKNPYAGIMFLLPAIVGLWSDPSLSTDLTTQGMHMRDKVSGLEVSLSTKASVERFDYSLRARYFLQFLPWAILLGCADDWADACKPDEPPEGADTGYWVARNAYYSSRAISHTIHSVSSSAISVYVASQSASSGGGGGFSAGGGSGGGGGGSW